MILIIIPLLLILVLTTLRAVCVKSFKSHLIIDGIIFVLMLALSAYKHFTVIRVAVLSVLLLWMIAGAVVRRYYSVFDFWLANKMCRLFKLPEYKSVEQMDEDKNHAQSFSVELAYYAVEAGICVLAALI